MMCDDVAQASLKLLVLLVPVSPMRSDDRLYQHARLLLPGNCLWAARSWMEGQSMRKVLEGQGMREVLEGQGTSVFVPQPGSWSLTSQGVFRETAMCLDHVLLEVTR